MGGKGKLTNKQASAIGLEMTDNGQNNHEKERVKTQKKSDNVKPR